MERLLGLACLGCLAVSPGTARAADYACLIEPMQVLKLAAPVQGLVSSVEVDRGDRVRKGQVVARLESDTEAVAVLVAQVRAANDTAVASGRARLEFLRRKQVRNEKLRTTDAVSFAQLDEATADAHVAEAQLREAELNLAMNRLEVRRAEAQLRQRSIVSPVDGIITERALGPGEFRNDQAHILTVAEIDPLRVEAFLPIGTFGQVKVGQAAEVTPERPIGGTYTATVTVVDHVMDAASGTIGIRLELRNPDLALPAGINCRVRFPGL